MYETGIKQQVIEEIQELALKYKVSKVILFGSYARRDYKKTSSTREKQCNPFLQLENCSLNYSISEEKFL